MTRATALLAVLGLMVLGAGSAFATDGDFNSDGSVDGADQQILLDALGSGEGDPDFLAAGDHDGDGLITLRDVAHFAKGAN
jgi:hypothetical protein